jgi:hypothetical protein
MDTDAPYTDASRARLAVSLEAQELSDLARRWVNVPPGELRSSGSGGDRGGTVEAVRRLCAQADWVMTQAVVYERVGGSTWEQIGEALGVSKQAAHERYAGAEREFREALREPEGVGESGEPYIRLNAAAYEPDRFARDLDAWARRHREPTDAFDDARPVSGQLARMDAHTEILALGSRRQWLFRKYIVPPASELLGLARRELAIWERLAGEDAGRGRRTAANRAEEVRRAIQALEPEARAGEEGV